MLGSANTDVPETLRVFRNHGIEVSFLVPTETALKKSIIDATQIFRSFLKQNKIHDFESQQQGPDHKVLIETLYVSGGVVLETETSLHRPLTKSGDPRVWFHSITKHCAPNDLLGVIHKGGRLAVINCAQTNLSATLTNTDGPLKDFIPSKLLQISGTALELLDKLKGISSRGFIQTMRPNDTGVGFTLETLLGIKANSSKAPDFKGIEIKSARQRSQMSGRTTLFSKTPNWEISSLKGSKDILEVRGRFNDKKNRRQLFHEISAVSPNSYGLQLLVEQNNGMLHQTFQAGQAKKVHDVSWELKTLMTALEKKHSETFWVTAKTEGKSGDSTEKFHYITVKHTRGLEVDNFAMLLDIGVITLDYTIRETATGGAKDQGYLFKIASKNLDLLFSDVQTYDLTSH